MRPVLSLLLLSASCALAALPEPDVVFYGRVLHLGGGEEHLVTSGELSWKVEPFESSRLYSTFESKTQLAPLNEGTMSYSIRIPNHLVVDGTITGVLPGIALPNEAGLPFRNTSIMIDGMPARLADPEGFSFDVSSEKRSSFRQLDLILSGPLPDSDGDQIPDWWEEKYGTNPAIADASADRDGDGLTNLAEYQAGTNPVEQDVQPRLATEYLVSFPVGGSAVPMVQAIDGDSLPADLVYTVADLPGELQLELLGQPGALGQLWFTQDDVDRGRVLIHHRGSRSRQFTLALTLRDEDPAHAAVSTKLRLSISEASELWQGWELPEDAKPETMPIVHDASGVAGGAHLQTPSSGMSLAQSPEWESGRFFVGSTGADVLLGSTKDDLFIPGASDTLTGGPGRDRFLLAHARGEVTITDFSLDDRDVIDLRGLLEPSAKWLSDHVRRLGDTLIVDANGDGSGFTDLVIQLQGAGLTKDVADLWDEGLLEAGSIVPETTLFVQVDGAPQEEGLTPAVITLRRRGAVSDVLNVPVSWSGTATMGVDYATLPSTANFAAGEKTTSFTIQPLADDIRETPETIQMDLGTGSPWKIADFHQGAALVLEDLPSRVWIEVTERVAYTEGRSPAQLFIRRSGPMNAPLSIKVAVAGSALGGIDYARLPASLTFPVAQAVLPLSVTPLAGADLTDEAETVTITVLADESYLLGKSVKKRIVIVPRPKTVSNWMASRGLDDEPASFLQEDTDQDGFSGLLEFAFNRNPQVSDESEVRGVLDRDECPGLEFERWPAVPEIAYVLQQSEDLNHWRDVSPGGYRESSGETLHNGMERVQVFLSAVPDKTATYLRIDVRSGN